MTFDNLISGLEKRGFVGIEGICSMGECHKDGKHYVLLTDGLIIYSSIPCFKNVELLPDEREETWALKKYFPNDKEFNWKEFDYIIKD